MIRLEVGDFEALRFQVLHAVQDGMVFDGSGNDMLTPLAHSFDGSVYGPVVRFGATGGEEHPVRFGTQCLCDRGSCIPKHASGIDAKRVQCAGICPVLRQRPGHGIHSFRAGLGGRRII